MSMRALGGYVAAGFGLLGLWAGVAAGQSLKHVEVESTVETARIVLDVEGIVKHRIFTLTNPERVVLDLPQTTNHVKVGSQQIERGPVKRLRVSQFKTTPERVTRIVADLRTQASYGIDTRDGRLVLVLDRPALEGTRGTSVPVTSEAEPVTPSEPVPVGTGSKDPWAPFVATNPSRSESTSDPVSSERVSTEPRSEFVSKTTSSAGVVEPVVPAWVDPVVSPQIVSDTGATITSGEPVSETAPVYPSQANPAWTDDAVFYGEDTNPQVPTASQTNARRINLDVQGAEIHTVLRTLSDYSGKNIIASRDVEGHVSARIFDTPWQDALGAILRAHGYGYVEENGIIRVGILQKIRNEELEAAAADRKREDLLPIETQVVRMQFADANELKASLSDMLSQRGKIQVDSRTNSLIVSDIPTFVAKVGSMARDLDSRTTQVEIVSKLVDVSTDDSKNLGIRWEANNVQPHGTPIIGAAGVEASTVGALGALRLGTVQSWGQLDAMLDALARSKRANVVSNPNITTVNNREAKILVGAKIPLIVADQAGNAITQLTTVGIQMRVTPHVNSDETITMDLHPEVSELSSQATVQGGVIIQTSEADTRVLVDNGQTAIIGGLLRNVSSEVRTGIPVLQDLPGIGFLFRNTNQVSDKRELIIFVTPHIIDHKAKTTEQG